MARFGSDDERNRYATEVAQAKAAQRVPYAVAPKKRLVTSRKAFEPGEEVRPGDLDVPAGHPPVVVIRQLVHEGMLIEADHLPRQVKGKPIGVVAGREGLSTRHGILIPGDPIIADDFDAATLDQLVASGRVVLT